MIKIEQFEFYFSEKRQEILISTENGAKTERKQDKYSIKR